MSHNTLENYYRVQFSLVHHHRYSLYDIEHMIPFELDLYLSMIKDHQDQEQERLLQAKMMAEAVDKRRF